MPTSTRGVSVVDVVPLLALQYARGDGEILGAELHEGLFWIRDEVVVPVSVPVVTAYSQDACLTDRPLSAGTGMTHRQAI